jgi:hypothetical protein
MRDKRMVKAHKLIMNVSDGQAGAMSPVTYGRPCIDVIRTLGGEYIGRRTRQLWPSAAPQLFSM